MQTIQPMHAGSADPAQSLTDATDTEKAIGTIQNQIDGINGAISRLEDRLGIVLTPSAETKSGSTGPKVVASTVLHDRLGDVWSRLIAVQGSIAELTGRIGL